MESQTIYISVLVDSLQRKISVMKELYELTKRQSEILSLDPVDMDAFDEMMEKKQEWLDQLKEIDDGFETLYQRVKQELQVHTSAYQSEVLMMQNSIRVITDYGVKVEALERQNKEKFTRFIQQRRQNIREFNTNNRTANAYHQHMANQHMAGQSYFLDKKK